MQGEKYKILIVEDDVIISQLIKKHVQQFGHHVLDIVFDSERALDKISTLSPDLILLDINILGSKDGIQVAEVVEQKHKIPYIFLTALSDNTTLDRAKTLSPIAYVIKPYKETDLKAAIMIGMSNYQKTNSKQQITLDRFNAEISDPLTEKEFDILLRISKGFTNVQMAADDGLSLNTVKWHTQNIYAKLDVKNRTAATQLLMNIAHTLS